MALYDIQSYQVVYDLDDGKWKVQLNDETILSTHQTKKAAREEAKRLSENKADRSNDAVRLEIYKKSGQHQRTIDINRKR